MSSLRAHLGVQIFKPANTILWMLIDVFMDQITSIKSVSWNRSVAFVVEQWYAESILKNYLCDFLCRPFAGHEGNLFSKVNYFRLGSEANLFILTSWQTSAEDFRISFDWPVASVRVDHRTTMSCAHRRLTRLFRLSYHAGNHYIWPFVHI